MFYYKEKKQTIHLIFDQNSQTQINVIMDQSTHPIAKGWQV